MIFLRIWRLFLNLFFHLSLLSNNHKNQNSFTNLLFHSFLPFFTPTKHTIKETQLQNGDSTTELPRPFLKNNRGKYDKNTKRNRVFRKPSWKPTLPQPF